MAFRFGFANGDEDDANADGAQGESSTPSALEESKVPPVKEHTLKELVGKATNSYLLTQLRRAKATMSKTPIFNVKGIGQQDGS
jgi:hypothetical protein